jgi:hypothetical protein
MRKIEQQLIDNIRNGKTYSNGSTAYNATAQEVTLYGHLIAKRDADGWRFTLAGHNTDTTRSRINALSREFLGHGAVWSVKGCAKAYTPGNVKGRDVASDEWFRV